MLFVFNNHALSMEGVNTNQIKSTFNHCKKLLTILKIIKTTTFDGKLQTALIFDISLHSMLIKVPSSTAKHALNVFTVLKTIRYR